MYWIILTVFRPSPVGTPPPTPVHLHVEVIHHAILDEEKNSMGYFFGLRSTSRKDHSRFELGFEVRDSVRTHEG
jgi:hypothetical protein